MDLNAAFWGGLPSEIVEQVLSFVPVPDLCRYRTVCKAWNRLICSPKFAAVHVHNTAKSRDAMSFIVMSYSRRFTDCQKSGKTHNRWCVLDLNTKRWYTVKYNNLYRFKNDSDIKALDGGLICQYLETKSQANSIIVHNPLANTAKVLPSAPDHVTSQSFPELSLVVDSTSHSFKVILINHSFNDKDTLENHRMSPEFQSLIQNDPFVRVYDSETNEWKSMKNPPWIFSGVGHIRRSIMFQGLLYVLFYGHKEYHFWRYNLADNVWEKLAAPISSDFKYPELVVSGNRFFLVAWYSKRFCLSLDGGLKNLRERHWFYKLFEIKVPGMSREMLFDYSKARMDLLFGVKSTEAETSESKYLRMSVFSSGSYLLFMSNSSGKMMAYDVVTKKWDDNWPQNPLGHRLPDEDCSWVGERMTLLLPSTHW